MRKNRLIFTSDAQSLMARTWRPAAELPAAAGWLAAAAAAAACGLPRALFEPLAAVCLVFFVLRAASALSVLRARSLLSGRALSFHTTKDLYLRVKREFAPAHHVWFGKGFEWTPEHSQKLYEISRVDIRSLMTPAWVRRALGLGEPAATEAIGLSAIEGLEGREVDLTVAEKTLEGGTLIVGTTQAGKGVLLTNLITQAIVRGETVIILDPKMSSRLKSAVEEACRIAGRPAPYFFHPSEDGGVRINPLASFSRTSELASRITAVMTEDGPFTAFAWSAVNTVCMLLIACDRLPTLALIESVLNGGLEELLLEALCRYWGKDQVDTQLSRAHSEGLEGREAVVFLLRAWRESARTRPAAIEAAAAVYLHDPTHYAKITASLMPVLGMLTSGALRESLSPDVNDDDEREILTLPQVLHAKGVLYVCLNSLPDPMVASAIGSILLADLASCAGARYNNTAIERGVVSLFVDECSNVINKSLIEILNKGAESGIRTTAAMQTVSDLAARLGSNEAARMALGNFNTLVSLRTKDRVTQDFVTETFGRTSIASHGASLTTGSSSAAAGDFSASYTRQVTGTREDLIPVDMLGKLPNCEFFASLAGGRIVKGRIPILTCTKG